MNYFSDTLGLVTKNDSTTENGGIFLAYYHVLKRMLNLPLSNTDLNLFSCKMFHAYQSSGLYLRSELHPNRTVSQDEITGFMVSSHLLKTFHKKSIWEKLVSGFGSYPAAKVSKWYNPGSYYSWSVLAGSKFSFFFLPIYFINLVITCYKPVGNTSSKLLYLAELYTMPQGLMWQFYQYRMKKQYGEKWIYELFCIYFWNEDSDFPLLHLSEKL